MHASSTTSQEGQLLAPVGGLLCFPECELQDGLAQHNLVAMLEELPLDGLAVDVGAVRRVAVLDLVAASEIVDQGVPRLDIGVLEQVDVGLGRGAQDGRVTVNDEL